MIKKEESNKKVEDFPNLNMTNSLSKKAVKTIKFEEKNLEI